MGLWLITAALLAAGENEIDVDGVHIVHSGKAEESAANTTQSAEVLRSVKPDLIFLEWQPTDWLEALNGFPACGKPADVIKRWRKFYANNAAQYPWLATAGEVITALESEWATGHQVYVLPFDGPQELTASTENRPGLGNAVWIFLRERFMIERLRHPGVETHGKTALVLCHDFHWQNLRFLLQKPTAEQIWLHYFGPLSSPVKSRAEVERELAAGSPTLWKYWRQWANHAADPAAPHE